MGLSQLFLLSLAASTQALVPGARDAADPKARSLPVVDDAVEMMGTLPAIAKAKRSLPVVDDNVEFMGTLPAVSKSKRSLPVVDDNVEMMGMLPAIAKTKRSLPVVDDNLEMMGTLPAIAKNKRKLPVDSGPPGLLSLPVYHMERPVMDRRSLPELDKRVVELQLENRSDVAYYAPLNIGTPGQEVYVQLDTGSYELWVNPDCSVLTRQSDITFCGGVGRYNPDSSSSANDTGESDSLRYGIGSANFEYYTDSISISGGDGTVENVKFGVATSTTDQAAGILGLGFGERNVGYNTLIDELAAQDVIATKAFSVGLGSKEEGGGVIVFGGVDTAKFQGRLARLPIIPADEAPDKQARYWVQLESIKLNNVDGRDRDIANSNIPVFLDTGATLSLLPPAIADGIAAGFGATSLDSSGFYTIDCRFMDEDGSIDFEFDGMTISVPNRDFIRQISVRPPSCYLGVVPRTDFTLLGASFLRSAYVVFDQEDNAAYIAQYNNCGTSPEAIERSSDIGRFTGSCNNSSDGDDDDEDVDENETSPSATTTGSSSRPTQTSTTTGPSSSPSNGSNSGSDDSGSNDSGSGSNSGNDGPDSTNPADEPSTETPPPEGSAGRHSAAFAAMVAMLALQLL